MISGKMRLEMAATDLGEIIEAAVEAITPAASAKDISIHVELDPAARAITADSTRLQQVAWNLLSNAVKFTPARGRVDVSVRRHESEIELTVADTGTGIDPTFLPYVFDRFRQADASPTRAHGGLGLGLAIVRHLVELHGGTVRAESAGRGAGAQFTIRVPARSLVTSGGDDVPPRSSAVVAAAAVASVGLRIDGCRVLVVDDDRESCEVILEALRGNGASVLATMSANEAIEALRDFQPHVVFSDIAMPGRDGYAVLAGVRAIELELGRRVPVAAITAYARTEDRERAIAAGFDEYLVKPVEPTVLASVVATLVVASDS
jgi:CheY-like chemotaxis protein/two-component sensor histidine kinase